MSAFVTCPKCGEKAFVNPKTGKLMRHATRATGGARPGSAYTVFFPQSWEERTEAEVCA